MNKYAHFSKARRNGQNAAERRCATKSSFATAEKAGRYAEKAMREHPGATMTPYHCAMCLRWHLTSKAKVNKVGTA